MMTEEIINYSSPQEMIANLGFADQHLKLLSSHFSDVNFRAQGEDLYVNGQGLHLKQAVSLLNEMKSVVSTGHSLSEATVQRLLQMLDSTDNETSTWKAQNTPSQILSTNILSTRGKKVRPKTAGQKEYVDAIDENTVTFGIGPAGSGKTYLAMAKAVQALQSKEVSRLILTRPAVEAGEKLGFLPGTLTDKIDPYLRPLYDALHDFMDPESIPKLMEAGTIEVAPLAYMRGRTLNESFIILDEAQNTTPQQMKMFLTRLGFDSKIVVTGDTSQVDLPNGTKSGLKVVQNILKNVNDVHFSELSSDDVVRNPLVAKIVSAYDKHDAKYAKAENHDGRA